MEFTDADCIRLMPELNGQELEIQELKGGITNTLYRVKSADGRDYVFRFYGKKTELFINRDSEMENLRRLGLLGITPRVIKYLPEQGVTVVEFIPGYVLKNEDFLREDLWKRIVSPIRTHSSKRDQPSLSFRSPCRGETLLPDSGEHQSSLPGVRYPGNHQDPGKNQRGGRRAAFPICPVPQRSARG